MTRYILNEVLVYQDEGLENFFGVCGYQKCALAVLVILAHLRGDCFLMKIVQAHEAQGSSCASILAA